MIGFKVFASTPTTLDLDGPILSFFSDPEAKTACNAGVATFVGVASAFFPNLTTTGVGSVTYQWYEVGGTSLDEGSKFTGTASTNLTINDSTSPDDNGRRFYLQADYKPGVAYSTGNAINEPITSDSVALTVYPSISVNSQPTNVLTVVDTSKTFTADIATTDSSLGTLTYQWYLDGSAVSDGTLEETIATETVTVNTTTASSGFNGSGIYFDLTGYASGTSESVQFTTAEESGIFHYINVPGVKNFPENNGTQSFTLTGGNIYGPCNAPNGGLYVGNETPVGGSNKLVVEEGGDDWNDMVLTVNKGYFRRLTTAPETITTTTTELTDVIRTTIISGANSEVLTLSTDKVGVQTAYLVASHTLACNSPVTTNEATLEVVEAAELNRQLVNYEIVRDDNFSELYESGDQNIFDGPISFASDTAEPTKTFVFYATEKDVPVQITLAGSAGQASGSNEGGEGGKSMFNYTLTQNTEYVIKLLPPQDPFGGTGGGGGSALFYEKGTLIAACGGGGGAASGVRGGYGGGVSVAGESGLGRNSGNGGELIGNGELTEVAVEVDGTTAGRMTSCTIGKYYQEQGFSPCADVGYVQWRNAVGDITEDTTSSIMRGYKAGQSSKNNGGDSTSEENGIMIGGGGSGVVGGNATRAAGSSGGGGSGYSNGNITVVDTQLGGNKSLNSFAIIEVQP